MNIIDMTWYEHYKKPKQSWNLAHYRQVVAIVGRLLGKPSSL